VLVVGAILAIGGISFAAGRASDDDVAGDRIHQVDVGDQYRGPGPNGLMPNDQMPNRGIFPGQGDGDGFRGGDRSGSRMGRGQMMPGDGQFPGWQMPGDGWQMPGGGWHQPGDGQLPGASPAPSATQAPSATEVPSATPSTAP
jgi:hypothetical protein